MKAPDIKTLVKLSTEGLEKKLEQKKKEIGVAVADAMTEYAGRVEAAAKEFVPVRTGLLQSSIHTTFSDLKHFAKVRTNARKAPHGHWIHFGNVKVEGTPFLHMAVEAHPASELAELIQARIDADKEGS